MKQVKWLLIPLVLVGGALWFLSTLGVRVEVVNVGSTPIHGVVVRVTGQSYALGEVAPGQSLRRQVEPQGESHVEVDWQTPDRREHHMTVDCYFEGGFPYCGTARVEIDGDAVVRSASHIGLWPQWR